MSVPFKMSESVPREGKKKEWLWLSHFHVPDVGLLMSRCGIPVERMNECNRDWMIMLGGIICSYELCVRAREFGCLVTKKCKCKCGER